MGRIWRENNMLIDYKSKIKNKKFIIIFVLFLVGIVGYFLDFFTFIPKIDTPVGTFLLINSENDEQNTIITYATSTINIADIINLIKNVKTSREAEELLDFYKDTFIVGKGQYSNEWKLRESGILPIGITVENRIVQCNFNVDWQKKIKLLRLLEDNIKFSGTFRFIKSRGYYYIDNCALIQ